MRWHSCPGRPKFLPAAIIGIAGYLAAFPAHAHTTLQGVGSFWSGVLHLLTSLDQLGFLIGLAIWTSFQEQRADARVIATVLVAAFAGFCAGAELFAGLRAEGMAGLAAMMVAVGVIGAARLQLGAAAPPIFAAIGGGLLGASGADGAAGFSVVLFALGGAVAGASVLSYCVLAARRVDVEWGRIALRAGASWIAAIGVMVLAVSLVGKTGRP